MKIGGNSARSRIAAHRWHFAALGACVLVALGYLALAAYDAQVDMHSCAWARPGQLQGYVGARDGARAALAATTAQGQQEGLLYIGPLPICPVALQAGVGVTPGDVVLEHRLQAVNRDLDAAAALRVPRPEWATTALIPQDRLRAAVEPVIAADDILIELYPRQLDPASVSDAVVILRLDVAVETLLVAVGVMFVLVTVVRRSANHAAGAGARRPRLALAATAAGCAVGAAALQRCWAASTGLPTADSWQAIPEAVLVEAAGLGVLALALARTSRRRWWLPLTIPTLWTLFVAVHGVLWWPGYYQQGSLLRVAGITALALTPAVLWRQSHRDRPTATRPDCTPRHWLGIVVACALFIEWSALVGPDGDDGLAMAGSVMLVVVTGVLAADLRVWRRWLPPIAGACVLFTLAPGWFFIGSGLRGLIPSLGWFAGVVVIGLVAPGLDLAWKHLPRHPRVPTSATPTAA